MWSVDLVLSLILLSIFILVFFLPRFEEYFFDPVFTIHDTAWYRHYLRGDLFDRRADYQNLKTTNFFMVLNIC
jgi:hypothetical protein